MRDNGQEKLGDRFSGPGDHSGFISGHFRRFRARQDRCLLLRQDRCLLLRKDRCLLLQEQTSFLSQHTMFMSQKSQLWQCHNVQVSEISIVQVADRRSGPNRRKWLQMGPEWSPGPENRSVGFCRPLYSSQLCQILKLHPSILEVQRTPPTLPTSG